MKKLLVLTLLTVSISSAFAKRTEIVERKQQMGKERIIEMIGCQGSKVAYLENKTVKSGIVETLFSGELDVFIVKEIEVRTYLVEKTFKNPILGDEFLKSEKVVEGSYSEVFTERKSEKRKLVSRKFKPQYHNLFTPQDTQSIQMNIIDQCNAMLKQ